MFMNTFIPKALNDYYSEKIQLRPLSETKVSKIQKDLQWYWKVDQVFTFLSALLLVSFVSVVFLYMCLNHHIYPLRALAACGLVLGVVYGIMRCSMTGFFTGISISCAFFYSPDYINRFWDLNFYSVSYAHEAIMFISVVSSLVAFPFLSKFLSNGWMTLMYPESSVRLDDSSNYWLHRERFHEVDVERILPEELRNQQFFKDYLSKVNSSGRGLYNFEVVHLRAIYNDSEGLVNEIKIVDVDSHREKTEREVKCESCNHKGYCPFQPGAKLEYLAFDR